MTFLVKFIGFIIMVTSPFWIIMLGMMWEGKGY
jgi:hypothetical protein